MEQLGDRIRKLREGRNMTQTELSEILGMKPILLFQSGRRMKIFQKVKT